MVQEQEMQVLQSSFELEKPGSDGLLSLVASLGNEEDSEDVIQLSPQNAEAIRASMERYIRER